MGEHSKGTLRFFKAKHDDGYGEPDVAPYRIEEKEDDGFILASIMGDIAASPEENARRFVAVWNACQGIETETLEKRNAAGATVERLLKDAPEMARAGAEARADEATALLAELGGVAQGLVVSLKVPSFYPNAPVMLEDQLKRADEKIEAVCAFLEARSAK